MAVAVQHTGLDWGTGRQNGGIATDALAALSIHEQRYQKIKAKIRREKAKGEQIEQCRHSRIKKIMGLKKMVFFKNRNLKNHIFLHLRFKFEITIVDTTF